MEDILFSLQDFPSLTLKSGEFLIRQGETENRIYFLHKGEVRVSRDDCELAVISDAGAVFGEMSILLEAPHTASVQCQQDSSFYVIDTPEDYLKEHPAVIWHIAKILGLRLLNLSHYLTDIKHQYEGHDHLGMVDDVLETLLNQQKTRILKRGDSKRETPDY